MSERPRLVVVEMPPPNIWLCALLHVVGAIWPFVALKLVIDLLLWMFP